MGIQGFYFGKDVPRGCAAGKMKTDPYTLPNLDPKLDRRSKMCPDFEKCLQILC